MNKKAAKEFAKRWQGKELAEYQHARTFLIDLLSSVYGIEYRDTVNVRFEDRTSSNGLCDLRLRNLSTIIEMKSSGVDLDKAEPRQREMKTPFKQVYDYAITFHRSEQPDYLITCNFHEFRVYSRKEYGDNELEAHPLKFTLEMLGEKPEYLAFLIDPENSRLYREQTISMQAGRLIGRLYNLLRERYYDPDSEESQHSLNVLCVRIVFCLFCEDAALFGKMDAFYNYIKNVSPEKIRTSLERLFKNLDTPLDKRNKYDEDMKPFPYVNGGLFHENIVIPNFTEEIKNFLLVDLSKNIDWSKISPTIFGGIFESTLNPVTRKKGGMHYTPPEDIHKIIDPLFLDDLKAEFYAIRDDEKLSVLKKNNRYKKLHHKICNLRFLDPAAGSGNFLTETYMCLRDLEFEIMSEMKRGSNVEMFDSAIEGERERVKLSQFYGIEINDFAVSVAETALWISRLKANIIGVVAHDLEEQDDFPLAERANIICANALRFDWEDLIEPSELNFIMGNPPFVCEYKRTSEQSEDMSIVFGEGASENKLDYVLCWYKKSMEYMKTAGDNHIKAAFVSTNSICQGESVPTFWRNIMGDGLDVIFAYRSFQWQSNSADAAIVSCVIVGFTAALYTGEKKLFYGDNMSVTNHINAYLIDFEDVWLTSRVNNPPRGFPKMKKGSEPTDARGKLSLTSTERQDLITRYPILENVIKPFVGTDEYTNLANGNYDRYCFWFVDEDINEYRNIPEIETRLSAIENARTESSADRIRNRAHVPHLFCQIRQPQSEYVVIPQHTSINYTYFPAGYLSPNIIVGNACYSLENTPLYLFGILVSSIHRKWIELVAGRLGDEALRYSPAVYNNFPWPDLSENDKENIENTANEILQIRENYPQRSLADLYNHESMPQDLLTAHTANDRAVLDAYGFPYEMTDKEMTTELIRMYRDRNS